MNDRWQSLSLITRQYSPVDFKRQYQRLVRKRFLAENIFAFLLQYMGLMMSVLTPTYCPVWFASGTAVALIFLRGFRVAWGIGLGTLFTYYIVTRHIELASAAALIFVVQSLLIVWLTRRYIIPTLLFFKRKTFLTFVLFSGAITALSSFLLILTCLPVLDYALWLQWWIANLNGLLIVAIAWIMADAFLVQRKSLTGYDLAWYNMVTCVFFISFGLNLGVYLQVPMLVSLNMTVLEIILLISTFCGLLIVIPQNSQVVTQVIPRNWG